MGRMCNALYLIRKCALARAFTSCCDGFWAISPGITARLLVYDCLCTMQHRVSTYELVTLLQHQRSLQLKARPLSQVCACSG